jgi:hypothetical protein
LFSEFSPARDILFTEILDEELERTAAPGAAHGNASAPRMPLGNWDAPQAIPVVYWVI